MKKLYAALLLAAVLTAGAASCSGGTGGPPPDGKKLFETYCASCHNSGGNMINPQKTLRVSDRERNGVMNASDVVKLMRSPGSGMTKFDKDTISDRDAEAIADYIVKSF